MLWPPPAQHRGHLAAILNRYPARLSETDAYEDSLFSDRFQVTWQRLVLPKRSLKDKLRSKRDTERQPLLVPILDWMTVNWWRYTTVLARSVLGSRARCLSMQHGAP